MVHLIRDPLQTVISGYWYHLNHGQVDTDFMQTGAAYFKNASLIEGLQIEAEAQLEGTLKDMSSALKASEGDPDILTMWLEDFAHNYTHAAATMWDHLIV